MAGGRLEETLVLIVGAGPAGLAISACLSAKSIPFIVLEKDDCCNSLWKKRAYDRCHLHLAKEFCSLPLMPHSRRTKRYMPKEDFVRYVDNYVEHFKIRPRYNHYVKCASFNEKTRKWEVEARDSISNVTKKFISYFLVVASGENGKSFIPDIPGLNEFKSDVLHSSQYKSGAKYRGKEVLVVGCGNSGMEIGHDLANYGANTSIVIRNPVHVFTRDMIRISMHLMKYVRVSAVDFLIVFAAKMKYGDLSEFGIHRPNQGPFLGKILTGRSPVIDVGTIANIRDRKIKVLPGISRINDNIVIFEDNTKAHFDALVFATGYKNVACNWLKDYDCILKDNGFPKNKFPNHWKGDKRLYCAGLSRMGLQRVSNDAIAIVNDIEAILLDDAPPIDLSLWVMCGLWSYRIYTRILENLWSFKKFKNYSHYEIKKKLLYLNAVILMIVLKCIVDKIF